MTDNLDKIWQTTINNIKNDDSNSIDESFIDEWLSKTKLISLEKDIAKISVPDAFGVSVLDTIKDVIQTNFDEVTESNYKMKFIEDDFISNDTDTDDPVSLVFNSNLNSKYLFDNFVVGDNNAKAVRAAKAVVATLGQTHNPFFIYAKPGMGKTHLIQATGNQIKKNRPNLRVFYTTSQDMISDILSVISKNKSKSGDDKWLDDKYQDLDVLIIDDIQMLAGKVETAEVFFKYYNNLHNKNKQIIITSDVMPEKLKGIEHRITSRFKQGLSVEIDPPKTETSKEILKSKIQLQGFEDMIPDEALTFIATHFSTDVRELEGKLQTLIFESIDVEEIDMPFVERVFSPYIGEAGNKPVTEKEVISTVATYYNITKNEITGKSRVKKIQTPRQIAMYLLRENYGCTLKKIGDLFSKDHSTVMNSCNKIKDEVKSNNVNMIKDISEIEQLLKN